MRIAAPTFRCRVRSSSLAPSHIYLSSGKPLEAEGYRIYRPSLGYPRIQSLHQSSLSTLWLKPATATRADSSEPVKDTNETSSTTTRKAGWSLFGWANHNPNHEEEAGLYGTWDWLTQHESFSFEADILGPEDDEYTRLVDLPEYNNDPHLWLCILQYRAQIDGRDGIAAVLEGLLRRHCLSTFTGEAATKFWGTILSAALEDEQILNDVWAYAESIYEDRAVQWPDLYVTVISSFIERRQTKSVLFWDSRLRPYFGLDSDQLLGLLKRFITLPDKRVQYMLRHIYKVNDNVHAGFYDELVPHLYEQGCLMLANKWRNLLVQSGDDPASDASKPYLRLHAAYFSDTPMTQRELRVAGLDQPQIVGHFITPKSTGKGRDRQWRFGDIRIGELRTRRAEIEGPGLQYLINRAHGETFGIEEKPYDDRLGARWFASSWVSIESTIGMVSTLGFNSIGPLSLQSLALREESPSQITRRIEELAEHGVSITESSYTRALRSFAAAGDGNLLRLLIHSDIHPDVFDDISTQRKILEADARVKNWGQYELIIAVRLAMSTSVVAAVSDSLLQICLRQDKRVPALKLLEFSAIRAGQASQFPESTVEVISQHVIANVNPHVWHARLERGFDLFLSTLLKKLIPGPYPLRGRAVRIIIFRLGRDNMFDELLQVAEMLVQRQLDIENSDQPPMTYLHKSDLPTVMHPDKKSGNTISNYLAVPHDLSFRRRLHPIRQIFDTKFQQSVVRWGFRLHRYHRLTMDRPHVVELMKPEHFHYARGIRVLAVLRDKGVVIKRDAVAASAMLRIAEIFWSGRLHQVYARLMKIRGIVHADQRSRFVLQEAMATCNEAWETLSSEGLLKNPLLNMDTLVERVQAWGKVWRERRKEIFVKFMSPRLGRATRSRSRSGDRKRFCFRRDRVCILGKMPERRWGPRSV